MEARDQHFHGAAMNTPAFSALPLGVTITKINNPEFVLPGKDLVKVHSSEITYLCTLLAFPYNFLYHKSFCVFPAHISMVFYSLFSFKH